jgi:hypothetical protein
MQSDFSEILSAAKDLLLASSIDPAKENRSLSPLRIKSKGGS